MALPRSNRLTRPVASRWSCPGGRSSGEVRTVGTDKPAITMPDRRLEVSAREASCWSLRRPRRRATVRLGQLRYLNRTLANPRPESGHLQEGVEGGIGGASVATSDTSRASNLSACET